MIGKVWEMLLEWLKGKPYWKKLQPLIIWVFGLVAVELLAYQYIRAEHGFSPSPWLFLGSYLSLRIILVFFGIAALLILFQFQRKRSRAAPVGKVKAYLIAHRTDFLYRGLAVLGILALVTAGYLHLSPRQASNIRIKFMDPPQDFNINAFTYLIYELNRLQRDWFFEVDFEVFKPDSLGDQEEKCAKGPRPILCMAEQYAKRFIKARPLIGITSKSLGGAYFAEHRGRVSVISTFDRTSFAPISTYDYLMYCVTVQSILIHLDAHGGGLPPHAFEESSTSHGGVFQFNPKKYAIKSTILAARFSPEEEELLFNRFGAQYTATCRELLTLEWLHSKRVSYNLEKYFGILNEGKERQNPDDSTKEKTTGEN